MYNAANLKIYSYLLSFWQKNRHKSLPFLFHIFVLFQTGHLSTQKLQIKEWLLLCQTATQTYCCGLNTKIKGCEALRVLGEGRTANVYLTFFLFIIICLIFMFCPLQESQHMQKFPPLEILRHTCLQSHLQTSPPTPQKSYPKFRNLRKTFEIFKTFFFLKLKMPPRGPGGSPNFVGG